MVEVVASKRKPLTMTKKASGKARRKGSSSSSAGSKTMASKTKVKAVDLVTGKATAQYFFDPSLVLRKSNTGEATYRSSSSSIKDGDGEEDPRFFNSQHLFVPCTIIKPLDEENNQNLKGQPFPGPTLVKTVDGTLHKISDSTKLIPLQAPEDYVGIDDVLHLPQVTEASLLHTLRVRYARDDIYTSAGPILISINPYKEITFDDGESIYSEDRMVFYQTRSDFDDKPPHLFQVADRAYTALMNSVHETSQASHVDDEDPVMINEHHTPPGTVRNQSIIISGESGAGKTEATKIIMKFLARITRKVDKQSVAAGTDDGTMVAALEDRVLSSNPLLETFGNAQTLRNDNSSRFGKFIHIYFDTLSGSITGASIAKYLLEKTRITAQVEGERNYHIFYQLLSGGDEEMLEAFELSGGVSSFNYLGNRETERSRQDAKAFEETVQCLKSIGFSKEEQRAIFGIAAAVLHLGNIHFEESGSETEHAIISEASRPSLTKACELLGLDEEGVSEAILNKTLMVNGKTIKKPQNVLMAEDKRDALAKMTYTCLFSWLVNCVNETLDDTSKINSSPIKEKNRGKIGFIGVLDIYGFECFENNGFEQMLINYCNEKLQRHFNRHLFEVEQQIYLNEGVDWSYITFNDNRPCLELIEGGSGVVGILNTLDDAWGGMGSASEKDGKFVTQLHKLFGTLSGSDAQKDEATGSHKNFKTPKFGKDRHFVIVHYAGEVKYTADGFVEKNMDTLSNELREIGDASTNAVSNKVFACGAGPSSQRSSIRGVSVGLQFRSSLQLLVADLERTQPHYIRCIKPNPTKSPAAFISGEILKQLRYSGMMEAIRIRREGYGLREEHESFYHRFSVLLSAEEMEHDGGSAIEHLVRVLSKRLHVTAADWQLGHSKIFLRRELADKLERLAKLRVHVAARTLGRFGRRVAYNRLSSLLVNWVRFRLHMLKKNRQTRAATKLASAIRRFKQEHAYHGFRRAVIRMQAEQRRKKAYHFVRTLRDPFIDMSFRECQDLLKNEKVRLEEAVLKKNFRLAAELEATIESVSEAVERKRPLTRSVLESRIETCQKRLDDALQRKAYSDCGPLQDELEELIAKRSALPTMDELKEAVAALEVKVTLAAKNRDFAGAAESQAQLETARTRLADALAADGAEERDDAKETNLFGFESRSQLEKEIGDLTNQISKAIQLRNFTQASSLQHLLEEREKLRTFFPTLKEIEAQLKVAREKLDAAIERKDFVVASKLNESVADLEKKLDCEKANSNETSLFETDHSVSVIVAGEEKIIRSRGELEKAIEDETASISASVAAKDFKKADAGQSNVENLSKLRSKFPTRAELQTMIRERRKDMDAAIECREFARADELNSEIERLEKRLEKEKQLARTPERVARDTRSEKATPAVDMVSPLGAPSTLLSTANSAAIHSAVEITPAKAPLVQSTKLVRKLRPGKPVIVSPDDSVLTVARALSKKRTNAAIIVDLEGSLKGIVTDTDFTRRVAARGVDWSTTLITEVMTPNPTCVSMSDSAMDALSRMIENHFRHLPVMEDDGSVGGVLDISKCLTDAISKLERLDEHNMSTAEKAVKKAVGKHGVGDAEALALREMLSSLMGALGGTSVPTLRSLLNTRPRTAVKPATSLREATALMAENKHAAVVVDEEYRLVGILGFRDVMTRVISADLDLDASVSAVMTPEPEFCSPEMTALEALQSMADNKFTTLPVCEDNGEVVGLVDVMDILYGCGGADGWRSIFNSSIDIEEDDVSDVTSVNSLTSRPRIAANESPEAKPLSAVEESADERPVARLRPTKPIVSSNEDSILRSAKLLASKRGTATLVVSPTGSLDGILTDKDITCRVVARGIDPSSHAVSEVMSANPICVSTSDSAMEALGMMVENRFRHLPVVDEHGAVIGTLDIAKCLTSIILKLENIQEKSKSIAEDVLNTVVSQKGVVGTQAAAIQAILGDLMSKAMGGRTIPTLGSILSGQSTNIVKPTATIRDVGIQMAENRHASVVVDDEGRLVGIFGFKDMLCRAVAKELDLDNTTVSEVMSEEPEFVSPETTALEALQIMADNKFLTLPVCDEKGIVIGLVDVMDILYGCGGSEGWKSLFRSAFDLTDDKSVASGASREKSLLSGSAGSKKLTEKTVDKLRPSKPQICHGNESVLSVAQLLKRKRGDSALVVDSDGNLIGCLTDTDFTRRVVARDLDPAGTEIKNVMTQDPVCISVDDPAIDALTIMLENHFRHLPVTDKDGAVVGLLDISRCLNDAIDKLQRSGQDSTSSAFQVVKKAADSASGAQAAVLHSLLGDLMSQAFGGQSFPTLRTLIQKKPSTLVSPTTSIREAARLMAESRHAALVVEEGKLVGIFGFKDMLYRALAQEVSLDTDIADVMTTDPLFVSPESTVLDALQTMHDEKFLTLPVCEEDGRVVGLVDVMDVIYGCGGMEGWRSIFSGAMEYDFSESASRSTAQSELKPLRPTTTPFPSQRPGGIPSTLEFEDDSNSIMGSILGEGRGSLRLWSPDESSKLWGQDESSVHGEGVTVVFKVSDPSGNTHRIKCAVDFDELLEKVADKVGIPRRALLLQYTDDEGDIVTMTSDDDVTEAWTMARRSGQKIAKIVAVNAGTGAARAVDSTKSVLIGGIALALGFVLSRSRD